jgi:hypothetical protein
MKQIVVHKGRTVVIPVSLGMDVSLDTFTSQIRVDKKHDSDLIATWDVSFLTDGTDGELLLTLDDSVTQTIEKTIGYMDIKRVSAGQPINLFDEPVEVAFRDTVTV